MQLQYQRLDREGGNFVMDVSNSDRYQSQGTKINYLLQVEPNPITTAATLWEQVTIDRLQRGNGFVYIVWRLQHGTGDVQPDVVL